MFGEILGAGQSSIHDSPPLLWCALLELELPRFPMRIHHDVDVGICMGSAVQAERKVP